MFKRQYILVFLISLSLANFLMGQAFTKDDEVGEIILKRLPPVAMMNALATDGPYMVRALAVGLTYEKPSAGDWAIFDFCSEYFAGDTWYMCFVVVNYDDTAAAIKFQWDLLYNDGAGKFTKTYSKTIPASTVMLYYITATSYVAKLGLFTVDGRVYGAKMGNTNKVMSQVYIY